MVIGSAPMAAGLAADGTLVEGPVAGPAAFPFTLYGLRAVAALELGLPLIVAGGICRPEDAELCFAAGRGRFQMRSVLWTDPGAVARWVMLPT